MSRWPRCRWPRCARGLANLQQYFLWYMVFLPIYLPNSSFLKNPALGMSALALWVVTQGAWLQQGFQLEFNGISTFFPGLWASTVGFFLVNCWILGIMISDGAQAVPLPQAKAAKLKT